MRKGKKTTTQTSTQGILQSEDGAKEYYTIAQHEFEVQRAREQRLDNRVGVVTAFCAVLLTWFLGYTASPLSEILASGRAMPISPQDVVSSLLQMCCFIT